jgi:hypothetical protein
VYNSRGKGSAIDVSDRDSCIDFGNIKLEHEQTIRLLLVLLIAGLCKSSQ